MEGFIVLFFVVVIGIIIAAIAHYAYNVSQPTVTRKVGVVSKRTAAGQNNQTRHLCLFEFKGGERAEYDIGEKEYALVVAGDAGELDTRGSLF